MGGLRERNRRALRNWLDDTLPAQSPSAHNSKGMDLESPDPLTDTRLNLLDTPALGLSHLKVMDIFYDRLPENKHPIYYQVARHVLLSEETAGGYTELLRLEQLVEKLSNPTIGEVATLARVVVEFALDELDAEGYVLYVKPVPAPRANKIKLEQGKLDAARAEYVRERKKRARGESWIPRRS